MGLIDRTETITALPRSYIAHYPDGLPLVTAIADIEWHQAPQLRARAAAAGKPTVHLDVYLAVVQALLPPRLRKRLAELETQP